MNQFPKVSEKTLELNIGAELLHLLRDTWGYQKAFLKGLTQREESQEGVDFYAKLAPETTVLAFQFKAPRRSVDQEPYRYSIQRGQHEQLFDLARRGGPQTVFYVFPFYVGYPKIYLRAPQLLDDTWFVDVHQMDPAALFGTHQSRTVRCENGLAIINPEYELEKLNQKDHDISGMPVAAFAQWYANRRTEVLVARRRNPWLIRGFRLALLRRV